VANKKLIQDVWDKSKPVQGLNPETWRRDAEGNKIRFGSYGTEGEFGWEIDHKFPESKGGSDNLRNLQPLHPDANREKSDKVKR
jgi:5-methylcytosine-specific restriction endonuclease McrA